MVCFRSWAFLISGALAAMLASSCPVDAAERAVVSAAASLRDALAEVGQAYQLRHGEVELAFNFASSGQLMTQTTSSHTDQACRLRATLELSSKQHNEGI
jgi:ABC-type molybdate transport system substrate-binding protein